MFAKYLVPAILVGALIGISSCGDNNENAAKDAEIAALRARLAGAGVKAGATVTTTATATFTQNVTVSNTATGTNTNITRQ